MSRMGPWPSHRSLMSSGIASSQQASLRVQIGYKGLSRRPQGPCRDFFARKCLKRTSTRSCAQVLDEAAAPAHLADDHNVDHDDSNGNGNRGSSIKEDFKKPLGGEQQLLGNEHHQSGAEEAGMPICCSWSCHYPLCDLKAGFSCRICVKEGASGLPRLQPCMHAAYCIMQSGCLSHRDLMLKRKVSLCRGCYHAWCCCRNPAGVFAASGLASSLQSGCLLCLNTHGSRPDPAERPANGNLKGDTAHCPAAILTALSLVVMRQ